MPEKTIDEDASSDTPKRESRSNAKKQLESPRRFETAGGRTVFALNFETFPNFFNNVYVLDDGSRRVLVDVGSGFGDSNLHLERGLASIGERYGARIRFEDLDAVVITHAHTDHFGGLEFVRERCQAPIAIHRLDLRVLSHYEERVIVAARNLDNFLAGAGVSPEHRQRMMQMYKAPKERFQSLQVDQVLEEGAPVLDSEGRDLEIEVLHTPGHCPGQVCLRIDDILLTADHVLARITPHQAPESITLFTGLGHYLDALEHVARREPPRLGLGGHEEPIENVPARIDEIRQAHCERLDQVLDHCREPRTVVEISRELFGQLGGYTVLLGLEEAGAHVEYLHLRGELVVDNLEELENDHPTLRYRRA